MIREHDDIVGLEVVGFGAALDDGYRAHKNIRFSRIQLSDSYGNLYLLTGNRDGAIEILRSVGVDRYASIVNPKYNERRMLSSTIKTKPTKPKRTKKVINKCRK